MKKIILSLAVLAFFSATKAQDVKFGLKGGLNISTISGSDASGAKSIVGFHAGGLVNIPVSGGFSVQPELVYSGQGAKEDQDGTTSTLHLNYLNIPVMAKYTFTGGFYAETGPQLGFLLSAKAKASGASYDVKSTFKSTDFAWGIGIGYQSETGFGGGVRYNYGLGKLDKQGSAKVYNSVFQIGVHYLFGGSGGSKK
ncbi:MAG: PorT family protein [Sphingobacteriales bacterium]|nr:PorT family protein [Sphingobacteriales bacterium]MBI3719922.1 PorT family protein [Sphingobacteriales bacterium]